MVGRMSYELNFFFAHGYPQPLFQHHLLRSFLSLLNCLSKVSCMYLCFYFWAYFVSLIYLSLSHYHSAFITVALPKFLKSVSVKPPSLFFFTEQMSRAVQGLADGWVQHRVELTSWAWVHIPSTNPDSACVTMNKSFNLSLFPYLPDKTYTDTHSSLVGIIIK